MGDRMRKKGKAGAKKGNAAMKGKAEAQETKLSRKQRKQEVKQKAWKSKRKEEAQGKPQAAGRKKKNKLLLVDGTTPPELKHLTPVCRKFHTMIFRISNPAGYTNKACCDVCGLENLVRARKGKRGFFHCGVCRWDLCTKCAATWSPEKKKRKRPRTSAEEDDEAPPEELEQPIPRARREIWLPTDFDAVCRAPKIVEVISDWVEGAPV